jgi:hypothetical protein
MTTAFGTLGDAVKKQLAQALIVPNLVSGGNSPLTIFNSAHGGLWITATEERVPLRGGGWASGSAAGLAALALSFARSVADASLGCRPAFIA